MDEIMNINNSVRNLCEPARNQQLVADWLQRLQREGFADSISSASLVESNGDETDLAIEVQEFFPEEEIIVFDANQGGAVVTSSINGLLAANSRSVEPTAQQPQSRRLPDPDFNSMSYELQQGYRILRELMIDSNKSFVGPFLNPVDANASGCSDYYERIKRPMWMRKMHEKFLKESYQTITEFVSDMRLMLENCYRFNGPDHSISRKAQRLETLLEQKLALLSRELRDKTSLIATSGRGQGELLSGSRRLKASGPHDSSALLNELRRQKAQRDREKRRQQMMDKRQHYEAFLQSLQSWEDSLLDEPIRSHLRAMWEIPQTCLFLVLCSTPLGLNEVSVYELELSFLMPRESSMFQKLMTSLLSTPHQRIRLDSKPLMPYRVWNERLTTLLRHWYKVLNDHHRDVTQTCTKLGVEEHFFKVLGMTSPLDYRSFEELSLYQRVWIVKSLCDHCMETQKCLIDAIEQQPSSDHRALLLGIDSIGYSYIHFPQFCGADLRIYRQKFKEKVEKQQRNTKRSKQLRSKQKTKRCVAASSRGSSVPTSSVPSPSAIQRTRDSRLRQNPRKVAPQRAEEMADTDASCATSDSSLVESESSSDEENVVMAEAFQSPSKLNDSVPECSPLPHDVTALEGASVLRRSLRKIIEESKKDAVCTGSKDSSPRSASRRLSANQSSASVGRRQPCVSNSRKSKLIENVDSNSAMKQEQSKKNSVSEISSKGKIDSRHDINDVMDIVDMDTVDSSEQSSVSSLRVLKQSRRCIGQSFVGDVEWSSFLGESETNSVDSESTGLELNNDIRQRTDVMQVGSPVNGSLSKPTNSTPVKNIEGTAHQDQHECCVISGHETNCVRDSVLPTKHVANVTRVTNEINKSQMDIIVKDVDSKMEVVDEVMNTNLKISNVVTSIDVKPISSDCSALHTQVKQESNSAELTCEAELKDVGERVENATHSMCETVDNEDCKAITVGGIDRFNDEKADLLACDDEDKKADILSGIVENELVKVKEEPPEILTPDCSEFELVADNIESLRQLVAKFASSQQSRDVSLVGRLKSYETNSASDNIGGCEAELYNRLSSLLTELEPFEQKLIQLNKKMKIKMRKEKENYEENEPTKEEQNDNLWQTSDSEESYTEQSNSSIAPENNDSSEASFVAPFVDESGFNLRSSVRRRTAAPSIQVSRLRKRKVDQSEDHLSTKKLKSDKSSTAHSESSVKLCTSGADTQSYSSTARSNGTNAARAPHRALLRIDQPNGTVCFIALDNVSDLSKLPVTSVIQHLMANQKMTFSQAPANSRPSMSQTATSSQRLTLPQALSSQRITSAGMSQPLQAEANPLNLAGHGSSLNTMFSNRTDISCDPVASQISAVNSMFSHKTNFSTSRAESLKNSLSYTSLAHLISPTNQRSASHTMIPPSSSIQHQLNLTPSKVTRSNPASDQTFSMPLLASPRPLGLKSEVSVMNSGIAALLSAAMSVTPSSLASDTRTSPVEKSQNADSVVLVNPTASSVRAHLGHAAPRLTLVNNQNPTDANVRSVFVNMLANQHAPSHVQNRMLAVPLINGAASVTSTPTIPPKPLLTSLPLTAPNLPAGVMPLPGKLQQYPRYAGSLTVRALLEGRVTTPIDTLLPKSTSDSVLPGPTALVASALPSMATNLLLTSSSDTSTGLSLNTSNVVISKASGMFKVSTCTAGRVPVNSTGATAVPVVHSTHTTVSASLDLLNSHALNRTVRPAMFSNLSPAMLAGFQLPVMVKASSAAVQHTPLVTTAASLTLQRSPLSTTGISVPVQRTPLATNLPVHHTLFETSTGVVPLQRPVQTAGSSAVPRVEFTVVGGPQLQQLQTLKLLPGSTGSQIALQVVTNDSCTQQSNLVQLIPQSVMSQLVSAGLDINSIRAFVPQNRLRGPSPVFARNNTRTTTVMRAPIPALPHINELNNSPTSQALQSSSPLKLTVPSSLPTQSVLSSSVSQGSVLVATTYGPSSTQSILRAAAVSRVSYTTAVGARTPAASMPTGLPTSVPMSAVPRTLQTSVTPTNYQTLNIPAASSRPVAVPSALQSVIGSGKLQITGMLQTVAVPGAMPAGATLRPIKVMSVPGKLQASSLAAVASPGKLQTVMQPGTIQASHNMLLLQSSNGVVQLVQLNPSSVQSQHVVNVSSQTSAAFSHSNVNSNHGSVVFVQNGSTRSVSSVETNINLNQGSVAFSLGDDVSNRGSVVHSRSNVISNQGSVVQNGSACSESSVDVVTSDPNEQAAGHSTQCLVDAANLFLMAANVVDQAKPVGS